MSDAWWKGFFDELYIALWSGSLTPERSRAQAEGIWALAGLAAGSRVLDAPCGFGRIAKALAEMGATVLGVDAAQAQIDAAEQTRGDVGADRLRYRLHDLREPLGETGFDVALNVYSSLGYGSEDDDLAILRTLAAAVRPGGTVLVEWHHRDAAIAALSRGAPSGERLSDGTLFTERPRLDPLTGRNETVWSWAGPSGTGEKRASIRVYAVHELVALVRRAGLTVVSLHAGCTTEPFQLEGPKMGGRAAILARRPEAG